MVMEGFLNSFLPLNKENSLLNTDLCLTQTRAHSSARGISRIFSLLVPIILQSGCIAYGTLAIFTTTSEAPTRAPYVSVRLRLRGIRFVLLAQDDVLGRTLALRRRYNGKRPTRKTLSYVISINRSYRCNRG